VDTALAFAVTGLVLAVPALSLPFVTLSKFGNERSSLLLAGVGALWRRGMEPLAAWTFFCGAAAPIALLLLVIVVALALQDTSVAGAQRRQRGERWAEAIQHWAMPEVMVLAVLVAFFKLGSLVEVKVGPGLWAYAGMTLAMLLAWRSLAFNPLFNAASPVNPSPRATEAR
jgi:paraquat-inducible protein A